MSSILDNIYHGKMRPSVRSFMPHSRYVVLVDQATRLEDEITAKVPEDIAALFRQYATTCSEINDVACLEDFKSGTRLAVRFMFAALDDEQGLFRHSPSSE